MDHKKLMRIGIAAQVTGINRTTIIAAIDRGEIKAYEIKCGLPLVRLEDIERWQRPVRGRPRLER